MSALAGKTALVTGASSGLGVDFAHELARHGARLVLVARREDLLKQVQAQIQQTHGVEVTLVAMDLGAADAPKKLYDQLKAMNITVDVLVNNAGFGIYGLELDTPWEKTEAMLMLNMLTLTYLTKLFARDMVKRGDGYLLQVASIGAYQPAPLYAAYSATKSYVRSFSQALNYELKGTGVSCTVLSPGATATEFLKVSGQKLLWAHKATMMSAAEVAHSGIRAMLNRRYSLVPGWINWITTLFTFVTPDWANAALAYKAMKDG